MTLVLRTVTIVMILMILMIVRFLQKMSKAIKGIKSISNVRKKKREEDDKMKNAKAMREKILSHIMNLCNKMLTKARTNVKFLRISLLKVDTQVQT